MATLKKHTTFGEQLRQLRETAGMTLREVAANIEIEVIATVNRCRNRTCGVRYFMPRNQSSTLPRRTGISTQRREMSASAKTIKILSVYKAHGLPARSIDGRVTWKIIQCQR